MTAGENRFEKHVASVMLGVSKVPLVDSDRDDVELRHIKALLDDTSCLGRTKGGEQVRRVTHMSHTSSCCRCGG